MDGLCFEDLDALGRELDDPLAELEQDVIHILIEAFGSNPDVLNRGVGLMGALSGPANRIPHIKAQIESQLQDDDRVQQATCAITPLDGNGRYAIAIALVVGGTSLGFNFVTDGAGGIKRTS